MIKFVLLSEVIMNSREIMEMLFEMDTTANYTHSADTFKSGDPEKQVKKVGVAMFPSYKLIKEAAEWGADLLVVHEPVYYNHYDVTDKLLDNPVYIAKNKLITESGMAICRLHDHMHHAHLDVIALGEMEALGLAYRHTANPYYAVNRFELENEITAGELLERIKTVLGVKFARLVGDPENKVKNISALFGTPGHIVDELNVDGVDMALVGESDEWSTCEYVRDMSDTGMNKSMIIMGHCGSERAGMVWVEKMLREKLAGEDIDIKYFECGEPYSK